MNLIPVLAAVTAVQPSAPLAQGDARGSAADAAGPSGDFARALSDAGAPGRSASGAAGNDGGQAANGSPASDDPAHAAAKRDARAATADPASPAALPGPRSATDRPPIASAKAAATTPRPAAVASSPTSKVRTIVPGSQASPAMPAASPHTEVDTTTDTPAATTSETAVPDGAADAAALLAELQGRHPAPAAAPMEVDPALRREDEATAGASRLHQRPPAAAVAPPAGRSLAEPAAAIATAPTASSAEAQAPTPIHGSAADAMAAALPAAAMPAAIAPTAVLQPGAGTAAVVEARLTAAPGSAEFAAQLGSQLTTFVRDGVQHARLHLNPAEMGPVTVQIRIDGQAAQVHMTAEHGLTRQALEQSMPLLAGSLREAGLTLGGGGVFEQPRQPHGAAPPGTATGSHPGGEGADDVDSRPGPPAARRRGVVDLVA